MCQLVKTKHENFYAGVKVYLKVQLRFRRQNCCVRFTKRIMVWLKKPNTSFNDLFSWLPWWCTLSRKHIRPQIMLTGWKNHDHFCPGVQTVLFGIFCDYVMFLWLPQQMWLLLKSPKWICYLDPKDMKKRTKKNLECHRALFILSYRLIGPLSDPCWVVIGNILVI